MKTGTKGLLLVMIDIDPEHEEEFNAWYENEHFPERMACKGFLTGKRYLAVEGGPRYLALYEMESTDVLTSEEYMKIFPPSEWTKSINKRIKNVVRNVYVEILPDPPSSPDPRSRFKTPTRKG
jgi:hypothetical protein